MRTSFGRVTNTEFVRLFADARASRGCVCGGSILAGSAGTSSARSRSSTVRFVFFVIIFHLEFVGCIRMGSSWAKRLGRNGRQE